MTENLFRLPKWYTLVLVVLVSTAVWSAGVAFPQTRKLGATFRSVEERAQLHRTARVILVPLGVVVSVLASGCVSRVYRMAALSLTGAVIGYTSYTLDIADFTVEECVFFSAVPVVFGLLLGFCFGPRTVANHKPDSAQ